MSRERRNPYAQWYQQHKTLVWGTAAAAVTLYATYKATSGSDSATEDGPSSSGRQQPQTQSQYQRLRSTLTNYSKAASNLAETAALVSTDLRSFLTSDTTELPQSLRQLNKLLQAHELQETVSTVTASIVRGVSAATGGQHGAAADGPPLVDTIIEAVLSERGRGLVGMAVGVATRNATAAVCEFMERRMDAASASSGGLGAGMGAKELLELLTSEHGEKLLTLVLTKSIRTAVSSYVEATTGYNIYDDMLASISKQEHRDALTDILTRLTASFCKEAVISYRRATAAAATGGGAGGGANHAGSGKYASAGSCGSSSSLSSRDGSAASVVVLAGSGAACVHAAASAANGDGGGCGDGVSLPLSLVSKPSNAGGQVAGSGVNGRPSLSAQQQQLYRGQQVGLGSGGNGGANAGVGGGPGRSLMVQAPPPWLKQVVELVRERDVRSLAVDVVKNASREATRGAMEGLMQGTGGEVTRSGVLVLPACAAGYNLYVVATLALSLCMYALSPRLLML